MKILLIENTRVHLADSAEAALRKGGFNEGGDNFQLQKVTDYSSYVRELERNPPDIVLSHCDSECEFAALAVTKAFPRPIPFIVLDTAPGQRETAIIEAFRNGATDYIFICTSPPGELVRAAQRALEKKSVTMCSTCKKFRDGDKWKPIEALLIRHGIEMSHGICPECGEKFRQELNKLKS